MEEHYRDPLVLSRNAYMCMLCALGNMAMGATPLKDCTEEQIIMRAVVDLGFYEGGFIRSGVFVRL